MKLSEFTFRAGPRKLSCLLAEPDDGALADDPALLVCLASDRRSAIEKPPFSIPVGALVRAGHRAVGIDLPFHGDRIPPGGKEGIVGMCGAVLAGNGPFRAVAEDGIACVDACLRRGLVGKNRVFAHGTSRGGYCALRFAAADRRVRAVAALAPVTDWRELKEFAGVRDDPKVEALVLGAWAGELAGRPVFISIGASDHRVGTHCCARFVSALFEAEHRLGIEKSDIEFHVDTASNGHRVGDAWHERAGRFLMSNVL